MKKGKLFSILASIAMVLSLCAIPVKVSAAVVDTDVAKVGETGYATLQEAINNAENDTVFLLKDVDLGSEAIEINNSVTINGGVSGYSIISSVSGPVITINSPNSDVQFDNVIIKATNTNKTGSGIAINNSEMNNLTLNNCAIETTQRGITVNSDNNLGMNITLTNTSILLTNGIVDYDKEVNSTNNYNNSRGISLWQMGKSVVTINNSIIQGFYYSVNNAGGITDEMIINVNDSIFKGRAAINAHSSGTTWNVRNTKVLGINNFGGDNESFANIVLNEVASNNTVIIENSDFDTYFNETGLNNDKATQYLVALRGESNDVTIRNTTYDVVESKKENVYKGGIAETISTQSTLNVESGKYIGGTIIGKTTKSTVNILGGTFSSDPSTYVSNPNEVVEKDGLYVVGEHKLTTIPAKASTCTTDGNKAYSYCDFCGKYFIDNKEVSKNETVVKALGHKVTKVEAVAPTYTTTGNIEYYKCSVCGELFKDEAMTTKTTLAETILDKLVAPAETPKPVDPEKPVEEVTVGTVEETKEVVEKETTSIIDKVVADEKTTAVDKTTADAIKKAVEEKAYITTQVAVKTVDETKVPDADVAKVEEKIGATGTVARYLDLSIVVMANGEEIGTINKVSKPLTFTIAVPEDLEAENRDFYVVRVHNGVAEKLNTKLNDDGTLTFETDKFSTYALVYVDKTITTDPTDPTVPPKEEPNPTPKPEEKPNDKVQTSDNTNVTLYATFAGLALVGAAIVVAMKKREDLLNK